MQRGATELQRASGPRREPQRASGPRREPTTEPHRTCVGCRSKLGQSELLRFRRRRDGHVVPALGRREAAGRGAWLCPRPSCFTAADRQRAFGRAFASKAGKATTSLGHTSSIAGGKPTPLEAHFDPRQAWTDIEARLRNEIDLLDRSAENPHEHPRRRALARLVVELTSQPAPPERSSKTAAPRGPKADSARGRDSSHKGKGGSRTHG